MKRRNIVVFVLIGLVALGLLTLWRLPPNRQELENLNIVPGLGISNVLEFGMSLNEVERLLPDAEIKKYDATIIFYACKIPPLGVAFDVPEKDTPIRWFSINVDHPWVYSNSSMPVPAFFTGSLADEIELQKGRYVSRDTIVELFGEMLERIEIPPPPVPDEFLQNHILSWENDVIPFSLIDHDGKIESLTYPSAGIQFCLKDGLLYLINLRGISGR